MKLSVVLSLFLLVSTTTTASAANDGYFCRIKNGSGQLLYWGNAPTRDAALLALKGHCNQQTAHRQEKTCHFVAYYNPATCCMKQSQRGGSFLPRICSE